MSYSPATTRLTFRGAWNALTNTPTLVSSVGTAGDYYIVSVAGSTNLDGITSWNPGDWAVFNGTVWQKVDNTDLVASVFGRVGVITAQAGDYTKAQVGLGSVDNTADATKNVLSATKLTTPRNINGVAFDGTADVTVPAAGSTLTDAVPNSKLADMAANTIKGNATAGVAAPTDIAIGTNVVLGRVGANIVAAQLVNAQITNATIANAKLAAMAVSTIKGRAVGAGSGDPTDLTATQATAVLNVFTAALKGLVPASGGGATTFLRADGVFATPADVDTITHFVWQPNGGDTEPNVRRDWSTLSALMATFQGVKIVQIDDSGVGSVTMPAGQFDNHDVIFYAKPSIRRITVNLDDTSFVRGFASEGPLDWVSIAGATPILMTDNAADIDNTEARFAEGSTFMRNGGAEFMFVTAGTSARILLGRNCKIYNGTGPAIIVNDASEFELQLSDNAIVETETIKTGGAPTTFILNVLSPAAHCSLLQSLISAPQPWARFANFSYMECTPFTTAVDETLDVDNFGRRVVLSNPSVGTIAVNLPDPAAVIGRAQYVKNIDGGGNPVNINPFGGETIDGVAGTYALAAFQGAKVYSDGTNWWILATA